MNPVSKILMPALILAGAALQGPVCGAQSASAVPASASGSRSTQAGAGATTQQQPRILKSPFLDRADVQQELAMTAEQKAALNALNEQARAASSQEAPPGMQKLEQGKLGILTPAQRERLDQIVLWILGRPINDPDVRARLGLTSEQRATLESNDKAAMAELEKMQESGEMDMERMKAILEGTTKKAQALLTDAQRQQLQRLLGKEFVPDRTLGMSIMMSSGDDAPPPAKELPQLEIGKVVPDFVAVGQDGKQMRLSDLRGKIVVLDFWATWCGPCIGGLPGMEALHRQGRDQNVVVLALNVRDSQPAYDRWLKQNSLYTMMFAREPAAKGDSVICEQYGVTGIPTTFVIDRNGVLLGRTVGGEGASTAGGSAKGWDGALRPVSEKLAQILRQAGVKVSTEAN